MSLDARDEEITDRITLAKVAREGQVSVSTVSKVLNARFDVAPSTRARVEALLAENGYARKRKTRAGSQILELAFNEFDNAWAVEVIRGVETVARENGMNILLIERAAEKIEGKTWLDGVLRRRAAGVILVSGTLSNEHKRRLRSRGVPFVMIDPEGDPAADVPTVGSSSWAGGRAATQHLISLGHTRIAMIGGPADLVSARARADGFRAAMDAAGIEIDPALVKVGDFYLQSGHERALELFDMAEPPTAVFSGNDMQALGLIEAARERGLSVPGDVSVVGYDDIPVARWVSPPLTTVHQPLTEMAETAARMVLKLGDEGSAEDLSVDLVTRLIVRASTAPPRTADVQAS